MLVPLLFVRMETWMQFRLVARRLAAILYINRQKIFCLMWLATEYNGIRSTSPSVRFDQAEIRVCTMGIYSCLRAMCGDCLGRFEIPLIRGKREVFTGWIRACKHFAFEKRSESPPSRVFITFPRRRVYFSQYLDLPLRFMTVRFTRLHHLNFVHIMFKQLPQPDTWNCYLYI